MKALRRKGRDAKIGPGLVKSHSFFQGLRHRIYADTPPAPETSWHFVFFSYSFSDQIPLPLLRHAWQENVTIEAKICAKDRPGPGSGV